MILGFAHITKNVPMMVGAEIPNPPEKWPLMARRARAHRLVILPRQSDWVQEELVEYDTGVADGVSRLWTRRGNVVVKAQDVPRERDFLGHGLGFGIDEDGLVEVGSLIPHWRIVLLFQNDDEVPADPPLDIAGYAALAFYSSDVEADRDHLLKHGGRAPTEPFRVTTSREWKVVMLRSPEGTIIELLQAVRP